ncbi:MAG: thiamine pyrophosphate-dependent dehydrogenase E1 component subunit alpha [bacterium]|nr:thiamine pyrophosphate-dependent dehydrogenase E1 component subunit alpha [bacterium]
MQYLSDSRPEFTTGTITLPAIPKFQFASDAAKELRDGRLTKAAAAQMLESMMTIRAFEEMIYELRSGGYKALATYEYRGPTHLSIGMEASATGACAALQASDYITSTHRGHGDGIAKGYFALIAMSDEQLRARVPDSKAASRAALLEDALEMHVLRTIAELFGKEAGYCRGRGGGMHIADFSVGHLGANAIVGGGVPIGTGAGFAARYLQNGNVVCSFAGDGAYANGAPLESLNMACMEQFTNPALTRTPFGVPVIFCIQNNLYGMTHRTVGEVMGVDFLARRGAGFKNDGMQAEVVNGMDVLAVREALQRAARECREGRGPIMRELINYRYYGHSLSDPRNEYRTKDEETAWKTVDPLSTFPAQLIAAKIMSSDEVAALHEKVWQRNARAAVRAAAAPDPEVKDVIKYVFNGTSEEHVPAACANVATLLPVEKPKRDKQGLLNYRDALKEALIEEMVRDKLRQCNYVLQQEIPRISAVVRFHLWYDFP